jgi:hypothetical protein
MIFNLTLFFQIIHFGIAYFLLRRLLFIPILKLIDQEKEYHQKVDRVILDLEENIVCMKKQQNKQVDVLHAQFISHKPQEIHIELPNNEEKQNGEAKITPSSHDQYLFVESLKKVLQQKLHI